MRLHLLALLVAAAFATSVEPVEATSDSKVVAGLQNSNARNLRKHPSAAENDNDEERTFSAWIAEGLANWAKSSKATWTDEQLEKLAQTGTSADDAFKLFSLDNGVEKLLTDSNLKRWETYVEMLNKNNPDNQVSAIKTITNMYGDEAVAKMLYSAKSKWRTQKTATDMQAALFKQWIAEKKDPIAVWEILKLEHKTAYEDPFHKLWWEYVRAHAEAVSKAK